MQTKRQAMRRINGWLLVSYGLGIAAMNATDRGVWRHIVMGLAATLLVVTITLGVRARLRYGCESEPGSLSRR